MAHQRRASISLLLVFTILLLCLALPGCAAMAEFVGYVTGDATPEEIRETGEKVKKVAGVIGGFFGFGAVAESIVGVGTLGLAGFVARQKIKQRSASKSS